MTPATGTALLLLALFVVPGFVALLLREQTYAIRGEDSPFERLLHALFFSAVIYGVVLGVAAILGLDNQDLVDFCLGRKPLSENLVAGFVVALVAPAALAQLGLRWRKSQRLRPGALKTVAIDPGHSVDSGWNQMFQGTGSAFVRVTLTDGRVVGGWYGQGSLAGYSEHKRDLYLVERWVLDGDLWFTGEKAEGTRGLWLPCDSIVSVEVYDDDWREAAIESDEGSDPNEA